MAIEVCGRYCAKWTMRPSREASRLGSPSSGGEYSILRTAFNLHDRIQSAGSEVVKLDGRPRQDIVIDQIDASFGDCQSAPVSSAQRRSHERLHSAVHWNTPHTFVIK